MLNGAGDIDVHARAWPTGSAALGYSLRHSMPRADSFDYRATAVYYPPPPRRSPHRLATSLCVGTKPLPGGTDRRRLVVIAGPATVRLAVKAAFGATTAAA